jgi:hypothetical protein
LMLRVAKSPSEKQKRLEVCKWIKFQFLLTQAEQNAKTYGNQKLLSRFALQGSGEQPLFAPHLSMSLQTPSVPGVFLDSRYASSPQGAQGSIPGSTRGSIPGQGQAQGGSILSAQHIKRLLQLRVNNAVQYRLRQLLRQTLRPSAKTRHRLRCVNRLQL